MNQRIIIVDKGCCPIDKMVEIQNRMGLTATVKISEECYKKMFSSADDCRLEHGEITLHWDATAEYSATDITLKIPTTIDESKDATHKYRSIYKVVKVEANDIHYDIDEAIGQEELFFVYQNEF